MSKIDELRSELHKLCVETETRESGIQFLVDYYQKSCNMTEEQAIEYAIKLFHDGTIRKIQIIGKDGKKI